MIKIENTVVFIAANGRRYITMRGAVNASASFRIRQKYPDEDSEYDNVGMTYPGFHFLECDWGKKMFRRLCRIYRKHYKEMLSAS